MIAGPIVTFSDNLQEEFRLELASLICNYNDVGLSWQQILEVLTEDYGNVVAFRHSPEGS